MILFDVDGVFLSEDRCFDASALSVWELLYNPRYLGLRGDVFNTQPSEEKIRHLRQLVFDSDRVLDWIKTRGINSNWDMVQMTFSLQWLRLLKQIQAERPEWVAEAMNGPVTADVLRQLGGRLREAGIMFEPQFGAFIPALAESNATKQELIAYFNTLAKAWLGVETEVFSPKSALWELGRHVFQEWYLGDDRYRQVEGKAPVTPGKTGFLHQEIPLADPQEIRHVLDGLRAEGIVLGLGTGRPLIETEVPLTALGLYDAFDLERIVTADDVIQAERAHPEHAPLGKPQPYTYLKGYFGRSKADAEVLTVDLPLPKGEEVLIVGDSVADLLAARKMGCKFAATLTGLTGEAARAKFEELGADYIVRDVTELSRVISGTGR
ncbi:HAD family hydrolase [Polycladomyces subterraneus]|uniref:HAD hydrolase-like protein n=1 Tax=Polycladomyces subterraneus TaxID=1016997 RepID=A0ABT8INM4_9BACL|nr:HAD hydrolase-like protein [Polycladomyces subterraneus]MDN4593729.1 HAD hydrolase-like protein [Polycladomyces subterraneus]